MRSTVCFSAPQVGALLSNLTMAPKAPYMCPHPIHTQREVQGPRSPSSCLRLNQAGDWGLASSPQPCLEQSPDPLHSCAGPWPLPGNKAGINKRPGSLP